MFDAIPVRTPYKKHDFTWLLLIVFIIFKRKDLDFVFPRFSATNWIMINLMCRLVTSNRRRFSFWKPVPANMTKHGLCCSLVHLSHHQKYLQKPPYTIQVSNDTVQLLFRLILASITNAGVMSLMLTRKAI